MPLLLADFIYARDCKLNLRKNVDTTKNIDTAKSFLLFQNIAGKYFLFCKTKNNDHPFGWPGVYGMPAGQFHLIAFSRAKRILRYFAISSICYRAFASLGLTAKFPDFIIQLNS